MVDSFVVIVDGDRQNFFGQILSDDVRVQVFHDLLWRWRLFATILRFLLDRFLRINFAEYDEKVMAFLALHEACGTDKGFDVRAWISAFRARECVLVFAATVGRFFTATSATRDTGIGGRR